jgi:hypothetical protein
MPVPAHAPKLMNNGRTCPIVNPDKDKTVTYTPEPDGVFVYRDSSGHPLGVVLLLRIKDKKLTPTITYCVNTGTGEDSWVIQGFPDPRPLYNTDMHRGNEFALIVEGEKCTPELAAFPVDPCR